MNNQIAIKNDRLAGGRVRMRTIFGQVDQVDGDNFMFGQVDEDILARQMEIS